MAFPPTLPSGLGTSTPLNVYTFQMRKSKVTRLPWIEDAALMLDHLAQKKPSVAQLLLCAGAVL
jgi:hypothetical protein